MASAYPAVRGSKSSRIPILRTSKHFRKNSSQLELLKQNLQRKLFIEREEKLRICSAGDEHDQYISQKRPSLPPLSRNNQHFSNKSQRRRTVGAITYSRYGNGPKVLSPIKSLKEPKIYPGRAPQPELRHMRHEDLPPGHPGYVAKQQLPPRYPQRSDELQDSPVRHHRDYDQSSDLSDYEEQGMTPKRTPNRTPNRRYSRSRSDEVQQDEDNGSYNGSFTRQSSNESRDRQPEPEVISNGVHGREPRSNDFEIVPEFVGSRVVQSKRDEVPSMIDWNVCTEIIRDRTPTPIQLPDEGDSNMFRRGSPINQTPLIPPIGSNSHQTRDHRSANHSSPQSRDQLSSNHNSHQTTTPVNNYNRQNKNQTKTDNRQRSHRQNRNEEEDYGNTPEVKMNPRPKVKDPFKKKQPVEQADHMPADDKARMQLLIQKKQEELMKKIADEEERLEKIQQDEENRRAEEQKKRIEEQKRKRLEEDKKRKLAEQNRRMSRLEDKENSAPAYVADPPQEAPPPADEASLIYHMSVPGEEEGEVVHLTPCSICGRRFNTERLAKHAKICNNISNTKRKKFDTTKQRVQGTDHAAYVAKGVHLREAPKAKRKDWKTQHEEFQTIVKSARTGEVAPPTTNPDYVACPHCNRTFHETAAERHIPRCKDLATKKAPAPARRAPARRR